MYVCPSVVFPEKKSKNLLTQNMKSFTKVTFIGRARVWITFYCQVLLLFCPPRDCCSSVQKATAPPTGRWHVYSCPVFPVTVLNTVAQVNTHGHTKSYKQGCCLMSHPQVSVVTRIMSGETGNMEDKHELEGWGGGGSEGFERNQFGQCQPFHLQLTWTS